MAARIDGSGKLCGQCLEPAEIVGEPRVLVADGAPCDSLNRIGSDRGSTASNRTAIGFMAAKLVRDDAALASSDETIASNKAANEVLSRHSLHGSGDRSEMTFIVRQTAMTRSETKRQNRSSGGCNMTREMRTYSCSCRFRFSVAEFRFRWRKDGGSAGKCLAQLAFR